MYSLLSPMYGKGVSEILRTLERIRTLEGEHLITQK